MAVRDQIAVTVIAGVAGAAAVGLVGLLTAAVFSDPARDVLGDVLMARVARDA